MNKINLILLQKKLLNYIVKLIFSFDFIKSHVSKSYVSLDLYTELLSVNQSNVLNFKKLKKSLSYYKCQNKKLNEKYANLKFSFENYKYDYQDINPHDYNAYKESYSEHVTKIHKLENEIENLRNKNHNLYKFSQQFYSVKYEKEEVYSFINYWLASFTIPNFTIIGKDGNDVNLTKFKTGINNLFNKFKKSCKEYYTKFDFDTF